MNAAILVTIKSLKKVLPSTSPLLSGVNSSFWFVDFFSTVAPVPETLSLLTESMKAQVKANDEIRCQAMLVSNAIEYYKQQGDGVKVKAFSTLEDRIENFMVLGEVLEMYQGPDPAYTGEVGPFSLLSLSSLQPNHYRLWAVAKRDHKQLKEVKKKYKLWEKLKFPGKRIEILGQKCTFLDIDPLLQCFSEQLSTPHYNIPADFFGKKNRASWLWHKELGNSWGVEQTEEPTNTAFLDHPVATSYPTKVVEYFFENKKTILQRMISSLQFIHNLINMFGLKCEWESYTSDFFAQALKSSGLPLKKMVKQQGKSLCSALLEDVIGRQWEGARVELLEDNTVRVVHSTSLELWTGLIYEREWFENKSTD